MKYFNNKSNGKVKRIIGGFFAIITFISCGDDKSAKNSINSLGFFLSSAVASEIELPNCDSGTMGKLFYIENISSLQVCKESGWSEINFSAPTTGSLSEMRFTRATILVDSSDDAKDDLCTTEFGNKYEAGTRIDLAHQWKGTRENSTPQPFITTAGYTSKAFNLSWDSTYQRPFLVGTGGSNSPANVSCISKMSAVRFTRSTILVGSPDTAKDDLCNTEFGSKYEAGTRIDLAHHWKGIRENSTPQPIMTTAGYVSNAFHLSWDSTYHRPVLSGTGGSNSPANVFCIRKNL